LTDEEIILGRQAYISELSVKYEYLEYPSKIDLVQDCLKVQSLYWSACITSAPVKVSKMQCTW